MAHPTKSVDQSNEFSPSEMRILAVLGFIVFKKYLQGGSITCSLHLAPQTALVATHAVHEPRDISESISEIILEVDHRGVLEHDGLVKRVAAGCGSVGQLEHLLLCFKVLLRVSRTEGVGLEMFSHLGDGSGENSIVEVDVGNPLRKAMKALFVAIQIADPFSSRLVEIVPAEMGRDGSMHATDDAVECSLFKTLIVQGIQIIGRVYVLSTVFLKDIPEILGGLEGFGRKRGILRGFGREAVLFVNGIPDLTGAHARVAGISFGVVDETDVVTFGSCSLILGHAVISLVTLVVIFKDTALIDTFTQLIL